MTVFVVNTLLTIRPTRNATRRHTYECDERSRAHSPIPIQNHHLQHSVDDSRHVKFILFTQWFCVNMWFDWKYNVSKLFFIKCRNADNKERRMGGFGPYLPTSLVVPELCSLCFYIIVALFMVSAFQIYFSSDESTTQVSWIL